MRKWKTKNGYEILQVLSGRSNVFLLSDGKRNILIDTSVPRLWKKLQIRLDSLGIKTVDYLILTHAHFDHAGNASRIREKFNSSVIVHKEEAVQLSIGDNVVPEGTNFITRHLVKLFGKRVFSILRYDPCIPDILTGSVYDFNETGFNAYLLHTPGHTVGSVSLIIDNEVALVGDAMFGVFRWSVFPPFAQDKDLMVRSWGKLLETECSVFLPSHGTANNRIIIQKEYNKRFRKLKPAKSNG